MFKITKNSKNQYRISYIHQQETLLYILAWIFVCSMILLSEYFHDREIILPEVAALTIGVGVYRSPSWIKKPIHLFLLPSITAILGFGLVFLQIPLGIKLIILLMTMFLLLRFFESNLAPALATGLLPVVTHSSSWQFLASIILFTGLLALMASVSKKIHQIPEHTTSTKPLFRPVALFSIIMICWIGCCAQLHLLYLSAFPPIIVIGYEMIQKEQYPLKLALKQFIALVAAAVFGSSILYFSHNLLLTAVLGFILLTITLHRLKLKMPPAYAMVLLPMVLIHHDLRIFPLMVTFTAFILLGSVFLIKRNSRLSKI